MEIFRRVTDRFSVSPQISPADVARAAAQGFTLIINNRPEGEEPGQPAGATIEAAAKAAGLDYVAMPISGMPTPEQADAVCEVISSAKGPVLSFCRTGTRSIVSWAKGTARRGELPAEELVRLCGQAGYDVGPMLR